MTSRENKPVFVALEGGEGAGKSTQAQLLVTRLQQEGRPALLVHEPGNNPVGSTPSITTTVRNKGTLSTSSWRPDHTLDSFVALPSAKQVPPKN